MFVETKEAGEVAEAPAKIAKISEAIRIGARLRPQCTGQMFLHGKSCALGAAYEALYGYPGLDVVQMNTVIEGSCALNWLPKGFPTMAKYDSAIFMKNDSGETREQIADWLEALGY